jgi:hypothetical protein
MQVARSQKRKGYRGQQAESQNKKPESGAGLVVGECGRIAGCKAEFPNIRNLRYDQGLYIISPDWGGQSVEARNSSNLAARNSEAAQPLSSGTPTNCHQGQHETSSSQSRCRLQCPW